MAFIVLLFLLLYCGDFFCFFNITNPKQYEYNPICKLPKLRRHSEYLTYPEMECNQKEDWGYLINNTWFFKKIIEKNINNYFCEYRPIIRKKDDLEYEQGQFLKLEHGTFIKDEVFEVQCRNKRKIRLDKQQVVDYAGLFVQVVNKYNPKQHKKIEKTNNNCKPLNIMLISYDSVSRSSWLQRLPKTNKFMFRKMKFELLKGYNIVGDGTPAALIPIYTGQTEEELPNVLKNNPDAQYVDQAYPFIWKDLHKLGYISMHLEDWPHVGAFNYRMKGFSNQTCHHYYKHYQYKILKEMETLHLKGKFTDDYCIGAKKRHKVQLDLMTQFKNEYNKIANNLIIMHYVENSHESNERFNWIDNDLHSFLSQGFSNGLFDNTAIFLYSDHGSRFSDKRTSSDRYLEERLPFFSIYLPDEYKLANPDKYSNLKINTNLLTSPFDIYATVRDLTCLDSINNKEPSDLDRSISLLNKISSARNCEHIGISDHFCTCVQKWQSIPVTNGLAIQCVTFILDSINHFIKPVDDKCEKLLLKEVLSFEMLKKNNKLLFKIQFQSYPNNGIYETLLTNEFNQENEFNSGHFSITSRNDISRIDSYGEQPKCISDFGKNPTELLDIRKFCFCKDTLTTSAMKRLFWKRIIFENGRLFFV